MWFNNLMVYRLTQTLDLTCEALEAALSSKRARPCASQELTTYGFVAPLGKGEDAPLAHASSGFFLLAASREERILPGSVVRDALTEKIEEIETAQCRKVYKKERDQLKDEIVQSLLPRAFIRRSKTCAALDLKNGLVYVNASSAKRAEELLSALRECIGTLPVRPLTVKIAPSATFTDWVKGQSASNGLYLLDDCELRDTHEDGGVVRCKRQDLGSDEILNHLSAGKVVTLLRMAWQDKFSFTLDDKLAIKRLRFEDLLQEQAEQDGGEDALAQQSASFSLMMLTLAEFMPQLIEALGGEEIPAGIGANPVPVAARPAETPSQPDAGAGKLDDETLYDAAVNWVRSSRRASVSALQRHLKIGYGTASQLLERMEHEGIVTAPNSQGARDVVVAPAA